MFLVLVIYYMSEFLLGGVLFFVHYNGKYWDLYFRWGIFELGKTSHLFCIYFISRNRRLVQQTTAVDNRSPINRNIFVGIWSRTIDSSYVHIIDKEGRTHTKLKRMPFNITNSNSVDYIQLFVLLRGQGFGREFFSSRPQCGILETGIPRSNRFIRAPSSGGGSNAPRPAVFVPHLAGIGYGS